MKKKRKKLARSKKYWVGGVLGGIGKYFKIDPNILRIIYLMIFILEISIWELYIISSAYIIAWMIIPNEDGENIFTD